MDTLSNYLEQIVEPTFEEFKNEPSPRRALLAAIVIFHAIDRAASDMGSKNSGNLRKQWGKNSMAFKLIDVAAHRFKHVKNQEERIAPGQWGDITFGWVMERMTLYEFTYTMADAIKFVKGQSTTRPQG